MDLRLVSIKACHVLLFCVSLIDLLIFTEHRFIHEWASCPNRLAFPDQTTRASVRTNAINPNRLLAQ
jgi:hypothetical protein